MDLHLLMVKRKAIIFYIDNQIFDNQNIIKGWLPLYDTMHGIRGEIKVQVKVEIFTDCNEYRKSSSGVEFFSSMYFFKVYFYQL